MVRLARRIAGLSLILMSTPTLAAQARPGSSFEIIGPASPPPAELRGSRFSSQLVLNVRPASAVTLSSAVPAEIAAKFGAKSDVPFNVGRQLYGWPEQPGVFCDLLRARGLGVSAACLWDRDLDGRFEEGTRLDFNSASGDILGITPSRKIIGVRFTKVRVPLPAPIAYRTSDPDPSVTGKIVLYWLKAAKNGPPTEQIYLSTPDNYTGTDGLSAEILAFRADHLPMNVELYGVKLRLLGHDEKGALRYSVLGVTPGAKVPLLFRGYVIHLIGY